MAAGRASDAGAKVNASDAQVQTPARCRFVIRRHEYALDGAQDGNRNVSKRTRDPPTRINAAQEDSGPAFPRNAQRVPPHETRGLSSTPPRDPASSLEKPAESPPVRVVPLGP